MKTIPNFDWRYVNARFDDLFIDGNYCGCVNKVTGVAFPDSGEGNEYAPCGNPRKCGSEKMAKSYLESLAIRTS